MSPDARTAAADRILPLDVRPRWWDLVPLRKANKRLWARLRERHFAEHQPVCKICSTVHEPRCIEGHEVYSFADPAIVRLERVEFICYHCHRAIHLERTQRFAQPAHVQEIIAHYCRINGGLSAQDVEQDLCDARTGRQAIHVFYKGPQPPAPPKSRNGRVKARQWDEFNVLLREWMTAPSIDYGPFQAQVERSRQRKQVWRQTNAGQMHVIRTFLARHARLYDEMHPDADGFHPDYGEEILAVAALNVRVRDDLAGYLHDNNYGAARSAIRDLLAELDDPGNDFLPDHEAPWTTAMWQDSFG